MAIKKKKPTTLPGQETFKSLKALISAVKERMGVIHNSVANAKGRK